MVTPINSTEAFTEIVKTSLGIRGDLKMSDLAFVDLTNVLEINWSKFENTWNINLRRRDIFLQLTNAFNLAFYRH